jgi:transcriptional regulator with XRE-family HTH domain
MAPRPRSEEPDFLDEMIEDFSARNPEFPALLAEAETRRAMLRALAEERKAQRMSQTQTAAAMQTSQSFVARLETGATDALLSTAQRFASALGMRMAIVFVDQDDTAPAVVVRRKRRSAKARSREARTAETARPARASSAQRAGRRRAAQNARP